MNKFEVVLKLERRKLETKTSNSQLKLKVKLFKT